MQRFVVEEVAVGDVISSGVNGQIVSCIVTSDCPEDAAKSLAAAWPDGAKGFRACADGPCITFTTTDDFAVM